MSEHYNKGRQSSRRPQSRPNNNRRPQNGRLGGNRHNNNTNSPKSFNKKPKLSLWQKVLGFFGLLKSSDKEISNSQYGTKKAPIKSNTRVARSNESRPRSISKLPVGTSRLYVGNLSYEASESDIEDLFKGIGAVTTVEVIYNPRTHKSKGYGFVEMRTMDDARRAVEVLHEQPFMGRSLTVSAANERDSEQENSTEPHSRSQQHTNDCSCSESEEDTHTTPIKETVMPLMANSENK